MRFFSSSAFPSAEKLRFAASCSAAETMFGFLPPPLRCHAQQHRDIQQTPDIIWCSASISPSSFRADCPLALRDDAAFTPPLLLPSSPPPIFSPSLHHSPPPTLLLSQLRFPT